MSIDEDRVAQQFEQEMALGETYERLVIELATWEQRAHSLQARIDRSPGMPETMMEGYMAASQHAERKTAVMAGRLSALRELLYGEPENG